MKIHIETPRLLLRDFEKSDADGIFELDSDPEVHRFLGNKAISTKEEADSMIEFIRAQYVKFGIGRWAVTDKRTGEFYGWSGLKFIDYTINNHTGYFDIGYRFIRKHWGKGYATEAAVAVRDYAFKDLDLEEIFSYAEAGNLNSQKVLKKIGLNFIENFTEDGVLMNWYHLPRISAIK